MSDVHATGGLVGRAMALLARDGTVEAWPSYASGELKAGFEGLLCREDIEDLLDLRIIRYPYVLLVRDGASLPADAFTTSRQVAGVDVRGCIVPDRVWQAYRDGCTVVVNGLHDWHPRCRCVAADLSAALIVPVKVGAFLTPPGATGLAMHRDDVHVVAAQMVGTKIWHVGQPAGALDWTAGKVTGPPTSASEVSMVPGTLLGLQRGTPHRAETQVTDSLHVAFTLEPMLLRTAVRTQLLEGLSVIPGQAVVPSDAQASRAKLAAARQAVWAAIIDS
jgi:hypothetical protein